MCIDLASVAHSDITRAPSVHSRTHEHPLEQEFVRFYESHFEQFMVAFNKEYATEEEKVLKAPLHTLSETDS